MITFIRVDDRLIHGQCQTKIIPMNSINRVIGVDDNTANNAMLKKIFEMAAPAGVRVTVHTLEDAITPISKCMVNDKRTLIITRRPSTLVELYKRVPDLYKEVNIANLPKEDDEGFLIRKDIYIEPDQLAAIKELDSMGVNLFFQQFPGDGADNFYWKDVKGKYE